MGKAKGVSGSGGSCDLRFVQLENSSVLGLERLRLEGMEIVEPCPNKEAIQQEDEVLLLPPPPVIITIQDDDDEGIGFLDENGNLDLEKDDQEWGKVIEANFTPEEIKVLEELAGRIVEGKFPDIIPVPEEEPEPAVAEIQEASQSESDMDVIPEAEEEAFERRRLEALRKKVAEEEKEKNVSSPLANALAASRRGRDRQQPAISKFGVKKFPRGHALYHHRGRPKKNPGAEGDDGDDDTQSIASRIRRGPRRCVIQGLEKSKTKAKPSFDTDAWFNRARCQKFTIILSRVNVAKAQARLRAQGQSSQVSPSEVLPQAEDQKSFNNLEDFTDCFVKLHKISNARLRAFLLKNAGWEMK